MLLGSFVALVYILDARHYTVYFESSFHLYSLSVTDGIVFQFGVGLCLGFLFLFVSVVEYRASRWKEVDDIGKCL